jgi:UDP-glucose 4-epimerase
MAEHGVKTMVFSSTAAVYGEPESIPILEEDPTLPTNPYGESKLAVERLLKWCAQSFGLAYVSLRYFNVAGADFERGIGEAHNNETHLIPIVLQVALGQREKIHIFGCDYDTPDGTCVRDYIDVRDLCDAHVLALDYLAQGGESRAFNLGNGNGFSVMEVIEAARAVTGHAIPALVERRRPGDPNILVASGELAREVLGWKPAHVSLRDMISSAWQWHQNYPGGFGKK